MVIKEITPLRKQEFRKHISAMASHLKDLEKLGVEEAEVFDFFYRWIHGEEIFTAKFYRNSDDTNFIYETNFPKHFEYFMEFIIKETEPEQENVSELNQNEETQKTSVKSEEKKKVKLKVGKKKSKMKKNKI